MLLFEPPPTDGVRVPEPDAGRSEGGGGGRGVDENDKSRRSSMIEVGDDMKWK